jgi:anti-sigma regulatory factor (Ser/Thr protein kinase)
MRVPGVLDSLTPVAEYVTEVATAAGLDRQATYRLRLAIDEIATNVVLYGYERAQRQGDLEFHAQKDGDTLSIALYDTGAAFDPHDAPAPDVSLPAEDRPIGGLGVFLALKSVDELTYEQQDNRNVTVFKMRIPGAETPSREVVT